MKHVIYRETCEIGTICRAVTAELGAEHVVSQVAQHAFEQSLTRKAANEEPWQLVITSSFQDCVMSSLQAMAQRCKEPWSQASAARLFSSPAQPE